MLQVGATHGLGNPWRQMHPAEGLLASPTMWKSLCTECMELLNSDRELMPGIVVGLLIPYSGSVTEDWAHLLGFEIHTCRLTQHNSA